MTAKVRLAHIALPAQNPKALAVFYHDHLGLEVTLEGALPPVLATRYIRAILRHMWWWYTCSV
jgi:catechol 2,3-dioxygenase-like lactoylglutathione lyase family enzyme